MTHPTTQRINRARAERGIPKSTLQQLIGMSQETWRRRERTGGWTPDEVELIATVLRWRVETLIGDVA